MDCVDRLARAGVDALSEHADALEGLQNILLVESRNSEWLTTDNAADEFVRAARVLVSFLRDQAMSLMSLTSPSQHRAARAAVTQAAVSILTAVAGHPAACQWLQIMPEAAQLACALQNLPSHMPEHVPLVRGGSLLQEMISSSTVACASMDAIPECDESDATFATSQPSLTSSARIPMRAIQPSTCIDSTEARIARIPPNSYIELDQPLAGQGFVESQSSPLDCDVLEPILSSPPEATVIVEPFLETYRRSRYAAGRSTAAQRGGLDQIVPRAYGAQRKPTWRPCIADRALWHGCHARPADTPHQLSHCRHEALSPQHLPRHMVAAYIQQSPLLESSTTRQDEAREVEPENSWRQEASQGGSRQPCPTSDVVCSKSTSPQVCEPDVQIIGLLHRAEDVADRAVTSRAPTYRRAHSASGFGSESDDAAGRNTVRVRMSFDQRTESWQVAQLQSTSADLLGAIASQLKSMPDGPAPVDTAEAPAKSPPGVCEPESRSVLQASKTSPQRSAGAAAGSVNHASRERDSHMVESRVIKVPPAESIDQPKHRSLGSNANPGNLTQTQSVSLLPPRVPTNDACTQWSPATSKVSAASTNRQKGAQPPLMYDRMTSPSHKHRGPCYPQIDSSHQSKPLAATVNDEVDPSCHGSSFIMLGDMHNSEAAPVPRTHTPSPTRSPLQLAQPAQAQCRHSRQPSFVHDSQMQIPRPRSPTFMHPQPCEGRFPQASQNGSPSQHPGEGGQNSVVCSKRQIPNHVHQMAEAIPTLRKASSCATEQSGSHNKRPIPIPVTRVRQQRRSGLMQQCCPHSPSTEHQKRRTHTVPCRLRSPSNSHATCIAGQTAQPYSQSPMRTYAAAKRFGPGQRNLSAPCRINSCLRPAQQYEVARTQCPQSCSPQLVKNAGIKARLWESAASPSPKALWTPGSDSLSPMHFQRDTLSTQSHCSRPIRACTRSRPATRPSSVTMAEVPWIDSSDDSSSGSPVSRAATVWGCDALERALRQVESTLGRNSKPLGTNASRMNSTANKQPLSRECFGNKTRRCSIAGMNFHPSPCHAVATRRSLKNMQKSRTDDWRRRREPLMPHRCAQERESGRLRSRRMHPEEQCSHDPRDSDRATHVAPWADEPGVYKLEAAALRQAAQKFFRKHRENVARGVNSKRVGSRGRQRPNNNQKFPSQGSHENESKLVNDSRPIRSLSVSRNVPVSHTHTSLARVRAAQSSRLQQRQSDLLKLSREVRK